MNNNKQVILLIILLVAAVGVVAFQLGLFGGAAGANPNLQSGETAIVFAEKLSPEMATDDIDIDDLLKKIEIVTFDYDRERIQRNTMTALLGRGPGTTFGDGQVIVTSETVVRNKRVYGIIWDAVRPVAIVDNEAVSLGHIYPDGVIVQSIEREKVVFQLGDALIPIELKEL